MDLLHALALSAVLHLATSIAAYVLIRRRMAHDVATVVAHEKKASALHRKAEASLEGRAEQADRFSRALAQRFAAIKRELEEHGPHVREHDCRYELSSVENDGMEHHYRCTVEASCKARLILKMLGAAR